MNFNNLLFISLFLICFAFCCFFGSIEEVYENKDGSKQVKELSLFPTLKIFVGISVIFAFLAGIFIITIVNIVKFLM